MNNKENHLMHHIKKVVLKETWLIVCKKPISYH